MLPNFIYTFQHLSESEVHRQIIIVRDQYFRERLVLLSADSLRFCPSPLFRHIPRMFRAKNSLRSTTRRSVKLSCYYHVRYYDPARLSLFAASCPVTIVPSLTFSNSSSKFLLRDSDFTFFRAAWFAPVLASLKFLFLWTLTFS
jgi:hypothetical protein